MQSYFRYFGHAWLHSPKMIVFNVSLHAKNKKLKNNFIIHFFLTILHFKESCNLIGRQHFSPHNLRPKIMPGWWNIHSYISFHYRLFPRKTNITKFFKKSQKPYFGSIRDTFAQIGAKNEFSWKKGLCQFFNIWITYHCAKNQKNLMSHSWENCWRDTPKTSLFH